jgi:hypothetical protein
MLDAIATGEYPDSAALDSADLESAIVSLNGVRLKLSSKDFQKLPLQGDILYTHDLTSQELRLGD